MKTAELFSHTLSITAVQSGIKDKNGEAIFIGTADDRPAAVHKI
jgi:hypothetical protein